MMDGIEFIYERLIPFVPKNQAADRLLLHWCHLWGIHLNLTYNLGSSLETNYFHGRAEPSVKNQITVQLSGFSNPERNGTYYVFPVGANSISVGRPVTLTKDGTVREATLSDPIVGFAL